MNTPFTDLDHDFLKHIGGVQNNSFLKVLDSDIDENDDLIQPQNKFSIFSTNIQSINANIDELRIFIECLKRINYTFGAICIQESWLSEDNDTSQIQFEGYNCILQGISCS